MAAPATAAPSSWRPPGWIVKSEIKPAIVRESDLLEDDQARILAAIAHPFAPETRKIDGVEVLGVPALEELLAKNDFYTSPHGKSRIVRPDVEVVDPLAVLATEVLHNAKALRDAWNTPGNVWASLAKWTGVDFTVDPFWNAGAQSLPKLRRTLDGLTPDTNGMAYEVRDDGNGGSLHYPIHWRGDLPKGEAAAAVNGPHSVVKLWLPLCAAYGREEFVSAFVPYAGDQWWHEAKESASLVFDFGRVHCHPPPGVKASSPRSASAVLLWIPAGYDLALLPDHTRRALSGESFTFAYNYVHGQKGLRDLLCTVTCARTSRLDFGFGVPKSASAKPEPTPVPTEPAPTQAPDTKQAPARRGRKGKKAA
jgi:hypothetical protein